MSEDSHKPFHNPFAALGALKDRLPRVPGSKDPGAPEPARAAPTGKTYARAVVRMERSGRGGKEVTVVEQLALSPSEREKWLKALKAALGCGGVVEGDNLVLQGDHRKRMAKVLADRGVKKVITS